LIALDTNLLVWAHRSDSEWHAPAMHVLAELVESGRRWAIPWPCLHEFYRVVTEPRIFISPSSPRQCLAAITAWVQAPGMALIGEGSEHLGLLGRLAVAGNVHGAMIHDARIAAICLAHGVRELWTADRDFSRFPTLKTRNPLIES
jgi:toxin-antitoxin system PIN domain toxin